MTEAQAGGESVALTIDGRAVHAPAGSFLLAAARGAGIEIPALCAHGSLEPAGACRLCLVEVTHPDWKGWSGLMTACLYPVAPGLQVLSDSPRVREAQRQVLGLLAARCPGSELVAGLARRYGADTEGLRVEREADNCIMCGLCVRVCDSYATTAIGTVGRGAGKRVGTLRGEPPEACVGCGACAQICPTGNIPAARSGAGYEIWQRAFPAAACAVDEARCVGCGSCEEACPFGVARVRLRRDAAPAAAIPAEQCRGCGACVGACPSGAIDQSGHGWSALAGASSGPAGAGAPGAVTVFACARAGLHDAALPPGVRAVELPCTARASAPLLLARLGAGDRGVLVLGRHAATCRQGKAEHWAGRRAGQAERAAALAGAGGTRIRFAEPEPGPGGPRRAVQRFLAEIEERGGGHACLPEPGGLGEREGLHGALALLRSWSEQGSSASPGQAALWCQEHGLATAAAGEPWLYAGLAPWLDLLGADLWHPVRFGPLLAAALAVLARLDPRPAGLAIGGCGFIGAQQAAAWRAAPARYALSAGDGAPLVAAGIEPSGLDALLRARGGELPRPPEPTPVACDGSAAAGELVAALGHEPVDVGPDPLPACFALGPAERLAAQERLERAERAGARALLVSGTAALARWALVCRHGSWRRSRIRPVLAHELAYLAICPALTDEEVAP
ncbi:MAG: 4Fe-4S binding protein [Deltaproteobacteria bacterium]|nr:4Fe-4S binding protein [Deltaproteobacteria bacterium]